MGTLTLASSFSAVKRFTATRLGIRLARDTTYFVKFAGNPVGVSGLIA